MMLVAVLILACIMLVTITVNGFLTRTALQVIHTAVNSNMTRALDEVQQLHQDVTELVHARDKALRVVATLEATEDLSKQLIPVVSGIAEQQALVARNLRTAQEAVDGVAADLAESHERAESVPHNAPEGAAADAASKLPNGKE